MTPEDQARARADAMRVRVRVADDRAAMRLTAPMMRLHADRLREVLDDEDWLLDRLAAETAETAKWVDLAQSMERQLSERDKREHEGFIASAGLAKRLAAETERANKAEAAVNAAWNRGFDAGHSAGFNTPGCR